jgi:hypothetical protein
MTNADLLNDDALADVTEEQFDPTRSGSPASLWEPGARQANAADQGSRSRVTVCWPAPNDAVMFALTRVPGSTAR